MSWATDLGQLAAGVINNTNPTAAGSVINGLIGNRQYAQAATDQLNNLQMALMMTPQNQVAIMLALQSLTTMSTNSQLPAGVTPQLSLLSNPAVQANPVAVQQAIAAIRTLLNH